MSQKKDSVIYLKICWKKNSLLKHYDSILFKPSLKINNLIQNLDKQGESFYQKNNNLHTNKKIWDP